MTRTVVQDDSGTSGVSAFYRPLIEALQRRGVDREALQKATDEAERSGRSIRDVLINDHVVTEMQLTEASAEAHGFSSVDLVGYPIDPAAMAKIPLVVVLRHRVLGIAIDGNELVVGHHRPGRRGGAGRRARRHRHDHPCRSSRPAASCAS